MHRNHGGERDRDSDLLKKEVYWDARMTSKLEKKTA
jgi:hypothetical protein